MREGGRAHSRGAYLTFWPRGGCLHGGERSLERGRLFEEIMTYDKYLLYVLIWTEVNI